MRTKRPVHLTHEDSNAGLTVTQDLFPGLFGELRSLSSRDLGDRSVREALWHVLKSTHSLDPERHHDEVVNYVASWYDTESVLVTLTRAEALAGAFEIAPFGFFGLWRRGATLKKDTLARLLAQPGVERLREIGLEFCGLTSVEVMMLTKEDRLNGLRKLNVSNQDIGREGVKALCDETSRLISLESLTLRGCKLGDDDARVIAEATGLLSLRDLELAQNDVSDEGALALAQTNRLPRLRKLDAYENRIGITGAQALVQSATLKYLFLFDNDMTEEEGLRIEAMASIDQQVLCVIDESD